MAVPVAGEKILVTLVGELFGQTTMNTFWYEITDAGSSASNQNIQNRLLDGLSVIAGLFDKATTCMPDNWEGKEVWAQTIYPTRFAKTIRTFAVPGSDQAATTANVAAVIVRRGNLANRHNVGTVHIPISSAISSVDNGLIVIPSALNTALGLLSQVMLDQITAGTGVGDSEFSPVLVDTTFPGAGNSVLITNTSVKRTVRVMRRRTVGLGI